MNCRVHERNLLGLAVAIWFSPFLAASGGQDQLGFGTPQQCFFGGRDIGVPIVYRPAAPGADIIQVECRLMVNHRTVAQGVGMLKRTADDCLEGKVKLSIPPVNETVVLRAELRASVIQLPQAAGDGPVARKGVYIFHPDPVAGRREWWKSLDLHLFDPDGRTARFFTDQDIPHTAIDSATDLETIFEGILVLGRGLSLREHRGLFERAVAAAEKGARVLCLGFTDGEVQLPGISAGAGVRPIKVMLEDANVVTAFSKRFTASGVSVQDARPSAGDLHIDADRAGAVGVFAFEETPGWPWYSVEYKGGGALVVSNLAITEMWEESPVPRYLLLEILKKWSGTE